MTDAITINGQPITEYQQVTVTFTIPAFQKTQDFTHHLTLTLTGDVGSLEWLRQFVLCFETAPEQKELSLDQQTNVVRDIRDRLQQLDDGLITFEEWQMFSQQALVKSAS